MRTAELRVFTSAAVLLQQNALTAAIKEYGALRRTVYAARYLADETYRRRIARQLNKGENLHALRRSLAYAGEGALRRRHHDLTSSRTDSRRRVAVLGQHHAAGTGPMALCGATRAVR